ncbi:unnamed protein product, partial [Mesorhabditis belari]|uniref:Thioredoxin domain-containing protein n=1 Tax=Mesorhabditis belari TaxID=2138241 RepID=A0AAF3F3N8_9BILA
MWNYLLLGLSLVAFVLGDVVPLDNNNIDVVLKSNDVVFVNFYAEWCRFSQMLKPIYAEAAEKFKEYPTGKIVWASVDSDQQPDLAQRYSVNKYPTLKLFRKGELVKKEYRSQRSAEALTAFIQKQLDSGVQTVATVDELSTKLDSKKRNVIGYFSQAAGLEYDTYNMVASVLRDECAFHLAVGAVFQADLQHGSKIVYQGPGAIPDSYNGALGDFDAMKKWLTERCVPLVREITFENAEELTEEGLPFLILFKHPDDTTSQEIFTNSVIREIPDQKASINCLVADGKKFAHPLHHLGKSEKDLPVIAIDSFRHMYLFNNYQDIHVSGKLRQFVMDLHSGKLHREFHHGPDATQGNQEAASPSETQPPPSVFEKLKPSHNRYSILGKEEL